jgi:hypothetical protein
MRSSSVGSSDVPLIGAQPVARINPAMMAGREYLIFMTTS